MTTIETLPDGKIMLNVYTGDGWIKHTFPDTDTLNKYYSKAAFDWNHDVV